MNSKIARHKPIARPTAYDFNVQYDALNNQGGDYDCPFSEENVIREGELLVAYKDSVEKWLDKGLHVTSNVKAGKDEDDLSYVGVAVTDFDPRDGRGSLQQGLVASAGGLMTLVNNGPHKIVAGKPVYVFPPKDNNHKGGRSGWVYGTPKTKTTCYVSTTVVGDEEVAKSIAKIGKALSSAPRNGTFDICLSQM